VAESKWTSRVQSAELPSGNPGEKFHGSCVVWSKLMFR
jgi:hypothetical protein